MFFKPYWFSRGDTELLVLVLVLSKSSYLMDHLHGISAQGLELVQPNATCYPSPPQTVLKREKKNFKKCYLDPWLF